MTTTARLTWNAPTNPDGTLPDNLSGYEIQYFEDNVQNIQEPVIIDSPGARSYMIMGLLDGELGFRIRTIDIHGQSSAWTQWNNQDTTPAPPLSPDSFMVSVSSE